MTWEETIVYIRENIEYKELVEKAYFEEDLELNIKRFGESEEFFETLSIIKSNTKNGLKLLDIGCGNGISTINFALKGYDVTAVEPDKSSTVGAGAIKILKHKLKLDNVEIFEDFAENLKFADNSFDIVYIRQAMHHANDLKAFVKECVRVLKPKGLLLTVRDHVITDATDKEWFLKQHVLHKFYGGENAYKASEYRDAIKQAGASIHKELKYYDSVINYFPQTKENIEVLQRNNEQKLKNRFEKKLGLVSKIPFIWLMYKVITGYKPLNEKSVPGRMYSYIAIKE
jgi:ubiquinone/menaquinone biosynthesis C-methylase UbiE